MPNYGPVIDKLLTKSEAGGVPWKPTAEDDTFVAAIEGEVTFEIRRIPEGAFEFLMRDEEGRRIIELISLNHWDEFFEKLRKLYEAARVKALDVNKKLTDAEALLDRF
jgi:hypothetical protein